MLSDWEQPAENTLDSLAHGINSSDGIELDLRMTADGELVIHHDAKVSIKKDLIANEIHTLNHRIWPNWKKLVSVR